MEEDDEVELIVNMLENRTVKHGKRRLDAEDIFAERRSQRERKEREAYGRMTGAKYRRELANTEKQEIEKMKIMNKHWMPALRKKIRIARKVIEIVRKNHRFLGFLQKIGKFLVLPIEPNFEISHP